jgi:hypothetical protein
MHAVTRATLACTFSVLLCVAVASADSCATLHGVANHTRVKFAPRVLNVPTAPARIERPFLLPPFGFASTAATVAVSMCPADDSNASSVTVSVSGTGIAANATHDDDVVIVYRIDSVPSHVDWNSSVTTWILTVVSVDPEFSRAKPNGRTDRSLQPYRRASNRPTTRRHYVDQRERICVHRNGQPRFLRSPRDDHPTSDSEPVVVRKPQPHSVARGHAFSNSIEDAKCINDCQRVGDCVLGVDQDGHCEALVVRYLFSNTNTIRVPDRDRNTNGYDVAQSDNHQVVDPNAYVVNYSIRYADGVHDDLSYHVRIAVAWPIDHDFCERHSDWFGIDFPDSFHLSKNSDNNPDSHDVGVTQQHMDTFIDPLGHRVVHEVAHVVTEPFSHS